MPHCDVIHVWVAFPYLRGKRLQTIWESFLVSFEVCPCPLKLCLSRGQRLPVVVDDEVGDVDVLFRQGVKRLRYFVGCEVLA